MKLHHDFPFPDPADQLTSGFWSAADRLELAIPRCARCLRWVWYPEAVCPTCAEPDPAWTATSGRASLFTWTEVHRALLPEYADMVPYIAAIVTLEEDPSLRVVTRVVGARATDLEGDMPMVVTFQSIAFAGSPLRRTAPLFTPTHHGLDRGEGSARALL
ncbi:MAG: Zn-ribbon domain-containing OB-fold protein [Ilumatobacteraceae bacterium]